MELTVSFSKLSAQKPIINPNKLNVTAVNIKKNIIINGCAIFKSTNIPAVAIITQPIINDFVAAAPTNLKLFQNLILALQVIHI